MKRKFTFVTIITAVLLVGFFIKADELDTGYRTVKDALNREIKIPVKVKNIVCSGSGSLRLITYMQGEELVIGVDDMEKRENMFDARAYAIANPQYKKLPLIGGFRGLDNPELILMLDPQPDLIFKIYSTSGQNPIELQKKTGIPVVLLKYGDLGHHKKDFFNSLNIIGKVLNKEDRAESIISFINSAVDDLNTRTKDIPKSEKNSCFVGGIAYNGPHGFASTEPAYASLKMVNGLNVAYDDTKNAEELSHASISKEQILEWDTDIVFIDLATMQSNDTDNALYELKTDAVYKELKAVKNGEVYGLLPYNYYSINFESVIANAYYLGKLLFPDRFKDIFPVKKADEIYTFFVGQSVYSKLDETFGNLSFKKIPNL